MTAPNWDQNQVLTWSGKWHIAIAAIHPEFANKDYLPTLCGAYGYKQDRVPRYVGRLQAIASGMKPAPVCKKCQRSAAAERDSEGGE